MRSFDPSYAHQLLQILQEPDGPPCTVKEIERAYKVFLCEQEAMAQVWSSFTEAGLVSHDIIDPSPSFVSNAGSATDTIGGRSTGVTTNALMDELRAIEADIGRLNTLLEGWSPMAGITRVQVYGGSCFKMSNVAPKGQVVPLSSDECETDEEGNSRSTYRVLAGDVDLVTRHLVARQGYINDVLVQWDGKGTLSGSVDRFNTATSNALQSHWTSMLQKAAQGKSQEGGE
jgi:hypothetical protein